MRLGVNFCHDARQGIGFNRDAVRALRPGVVRFAVTYDQISNLQAWARAAAAERLNVLWVIPEQLSGPTARTVARLIANHYLDVTAGVEVGFAPAITRDLDPWRFLSWASSIVQLLRIHDGRLPIILGTGFDGASSGPAFGWFGNLLLAAKRDTGLLEAIEAIGVSALNPGRMFRRLQWAAWQSTVAADLRKPLAFTRAGWQLGEPFGRIRAFLEAGRAAWNYEEELPTILTRTIRRRWILDAYDRADRLGAAYFVLEPELAEVALVDRLGDHHVNRWPLYDVSVQRVDHVWTALQWRDARAARPREVA